MRPLKTKVSITLDDDIIPEIKELAIDEERSLSQYINMVLRKYLKNCENDLQNASYNLLKSLKEKN